MRDLRAVAIALIVITRVAVGAASVQPSPAVVASAGDVVVTRDELMDAIRQARTSGDLTRLASASTAEGIETMSRALLERKVLAERARHDAAGRSPEVLRAIASSTDAILAAALVNNRVALLDTTDPAARRFYLARQDLFRSAPRRKARHIVVDTREEAERALASIRDGADFATLAGSSNTDATRAAGGGLGWVARGVMVKSFDGALFALGAGGLSEPVETSFGWHVIQVEEVDPGALPPFELIAQRVVEAMKADAVTNLKAELFEGLPVSIDRSALRALIQ